jgi:hypothetical protein
MADEARSTTEDLDELYETLASDLGMLVTLAERLIAEMEAIDELRLRTAQNGDRLLAARRKRRTALAPRMQAIEPCQRASEAHQRG